MTTPAERDDAVERLLRAMRADAPAGGACLDAETLARWADGVLTREELADVTGHAAGCVRCQGLLAAVVRTEPPRELRATRRVAWTLLRWGLPLSTAAALALWFAVNRDGVGPRPTSQVEQAPASAPAQPAQSTTEAATDARDLEARRAARPTPDQTRRERDGRLGRRDPSAKRDTAADDRLALQSSRDLDDAAAAAPAPAPPAQTRVPPPVAEESAPPPTAAPQAAKQLPPPPQAVAEQIPGGGLAETVTTEASADARTLRARRAQAQRQWVDVPSPDPLVRWRFSFRGEVERSVDAGLTWTRESVGGRRADLLTGVAPSASVCWLAGQQGVVLRFTTADGWQRVSLPNSTHVVSIVATDALNATVRLAGGGTLTTTDGGKTWQ